MPIDMDTFEQSEEEDLHYRGETNAEKVMAFLATHPDQAFTQSEIRDATDVNGGSISVVLARLEERNLVRHKGHYWAIEDDVALESFAAMEHSMAAMSKLDDLYTENQEWPEELPDLDDEEP